MNERAEALINAPISPCPKTILTTAREVRRALERNLDGGNYGVYAIFSPNIVGNCRIFGVRGYRDGRIKQVKTGEGWINCPIEQVYVEG